MGRKQDITADSRDLIGERLSITIGKETIDAQAIFTLTDNTPEEGDYQWKELSYSELDDLLKEAEEPDIADASACEHVEIAKREAEKGKRIFGAKGKWTYSLAVEVK